ncbi:hypothetical protein [Massilia sp. Se16.2.3]|uniref:hypothetical protein n=1 Tax=Massilia sp. Se16.2.3 TaxID=2709303 RepID=UPI001E519712|nr:hypothetical protein [Massilia sp. Se16.2.3]
MHYPLAKQKMISLAVAAACAAFMAPGHAQEAATQATTTPADSTSTSGRGPGRQHQFGRRR